MVGFIFGGDGMPKTPQELERLRAVAQAMQPRRTPQNAGEGIASIGNALAMRIMMNKADKAEGLGIKNAESAYSSLFNTPDVQPSDTAAVPPVDTTAAVPPIASPQDAIDASPQKPLTGDLAQTEALIRQTAQQMGIDPDTAVKVARSEGLAPGVWQSRVKKGDMYEPSYGAFQMLLGDGKNFPKGMGNDFMDKTGLDPRDPKNHGEMIKFALQTAKKDGWRQWYGAKNVGINRWDGINSDQVASADATVPASAMLPQQQNQVSVVPVPDGFEQADPLAAQTQQPAMEVADNSNAFPAAPRKEVAKALSRLDPQKAMEVLNNPYLPEGRKETIRALLRQQFEADKMTREQELKMADPKYQLDLEKGRLELGNLKNPPKARNLTDDEEKQMGLDPAGVYQAMPDNTIKTVREPAKAIDAVNTEKAQIELENLKSPKGKWSKLNDTTIVNDVTGETKAIEGEQQADFKDVTSLRKELQDLPSYKNLSQALPIYQSMAETAGRSSKASDLNLVYGMGKIFDPTSVVREGEQVMVRNTASLPDWFQGIVASFNGDAALTPETRKKLMEEAYSRVKAYDGQFQNDSTQFKGIAARNKFNEADVIPTFSQYTPWEGDPVAGQMPMDGANAAVQIDPNRKAAQPTGDVPQAGQVIDGYRFKGGDPADPASWERMQ